ncbi:monosaccharide transporter [Blumeria hordei DH14]|uniref:Monosaccharide transporter n=1 Tax=Blumeria graminis f. sp. hordei (strain DH14) TaxID=546991 RepID=N1J7U0_BLUG1|nr:monosaccharide transporter [Blumeria hordei DH14]
MSADNSRPPLAILKSEKLLPLSSNHSELAVHKQLATYISSPRPPDKALRGHTTDCQSNSPSTFTISHLPSSRRRTSIPLRALHTNFHSDESTTETSSHCKQNKTVAHSRSCSASSSPLCKVSGKLSGESIDLPNDVESRWSIEQQATCEGDSSHALSRQAPRRKRGSLLSQSDVIEEKSGQSLIPREEIEIPSPGPRTISRAEHLLAAMLSHGERQMRGLTGKPLVYFTSIFVSLGVFLFGYDQGVMSGIITGPYFKDFFNQPTRAEVGAIVAILEVGAFFSSLVVGKVGDIIGRRKTILYGSMIFFVGGALQSFANGLLMMLMGRIIAGVGVGMLSTIVPVYQSEISPPHNRGKLACIEFSGNIIGYATSVWVDYFCSFIDSDYSWRIPLVMQCVMGALLGFGSLLIVESPRWLLDNDHDEEGIVVIANLYGGGDIHNTKAREEFRDIKMNVLLQRQEGEKTYLEMFRRYRTRVFIAMSAQAFAQLNGINVISYYAPYVFESAGWVGRQAILMTGINGLTYLLSTIPPWYLVDLWGRRFILLGGAILMMLSLSAISYFLYLDIHLTPTLVVIFVMIYNAAFGFSWGPIPWLYPPEILPLSIRSKGASLSTATNWAFNWLVGEMTPVLQEWITWRLYLLHAFFCATSFVVVYFTYPETAGIRLEDMGALFGDATNAVSTPAQIAETGSLLGASSPVPSMDLRRGQFGGGTPRLGPTISSPGIEYDPPHVNIQNGKPQYSEDNDSVLEGVGGWLSRMVGRGDGSIRSGKSGRYNQLDQEE